MKRFCLKFWLHPYTSANNYRASSDLLGVYAVNDRGVVLPARIQQNERYVQEEVSVSLEYSQDSHSSSVENAFTVNEYQVKLTSDIQLKELKTLIGINGDSFKGEFAVSKYSYCSFLPELFYCHSCLYSTPLFIRCIDLYFFY